MIGPYRLLEEVGAGGFGVIQKMEFSVRSIAEIEYQIHVENRSPREAGRRWMGLHPYTVEYWVEPEEE